MGMTSSLSLTELEQIGWTIERSGLANVTDQRLAEIAHEAIQLGIRPIAAGVLADPSEPSVARQRAFGRIASGLADVLRGDLARLDPNRQFARVA
jgi:hypothetical protein